MGTLRKKTRTAQENRVGRVTLFSMEGFPSSPLPDHSLYAEKCSSSIALLSKHGSESIAALSKAHCAYRIGKEE